HRLHPHLHPPLGPGPGRQAQPRHGADPRLAGADAGPPGRAGNRGGHAVNATTSAVATEAAAASSWPWPIDLTRYDRRPELDERERTALAGLGWQVRRRRGYDADRVEWRAIARLLRPLDDARAALRWCPDTPAHRR